MGSIPASPVSALVLFERIKRPGSPNYLGFLKKLKKYAPKGIEIDYTGAALTHLIYDIKTADVAVKLGDGRDIKDFDVVFFRNWQKYPEAAHAVAEYLTYHRVPFMDRETGRHASHSKLTEMMQLALAGVSVPDTLLSHDDEAISSFMELHGNRAVVKNAAAQKGNDNFLCESIEEVLTIVKKSRKPFLIQSYIRADGDYRFVVTGDKISFIMRRQSKGKGHIHNSSQGGRESDADISDFTPEQLEDVIKSAKVLKRDLAGVDLIVDKLTGKHYILEVNYSPQVLKGDYEGHMVSPIPRMLHSLSQTKSKATQPKKGKDATS